MESNIEEAKQVLDSLKDPAINIELDQVMADLLSEGIDKFIQPFESILQSLETKADTLVNA